MASTTVGLNRGRTKMSRRRIDTVFLSQKLFYLSGPAPMTRMNVLIISAISGVFQILMNVIRATEAVCMVTVQTQSVDHIASVTRDMLTQQIMEIVQVHVLFLFGLIFTRFHKTG